MSPWQVAAIGMAAAMVGPGFIALRGRDPVTRLVGLEMGGVVATLLIALVEQAERRESLLDLPLAFALLAFGGALVFARFLERWL